MGEEWKRAWLLALALAWMHSDDDGGDLSLLQVAAVAGQFRRPASNAANELTATLLVLVLFWWLVCAKTPAKYLSGGCKTAKLRGLASQSLNRLESPVLTTSSGTSWLVPAISSLCQYAHQST